MTRKILEKRNVDSSLLGFVDENDEKSILGWNSCSSNEECFYNPKSEVLWSREKNGTFQESNFFQEFSDFTEGSTSSCSWHNDDFDMTSSNKVKQSLEAVEDALYEQKHSDFISENVYEECCDWSNKFPYLRLKGKQIVNTSENVDELHSRLHPNTKPLLEDVLSSLQVEGRRMAIHASEKSSRKTHPNDLENFVDPISDSFEETLDQDGEYNEDINLGTRDICKQLNDMDEETSKLESIKLIEDKIIEKIAMEIWPKVLSILENVPVDPGNSLGEGFQLPPIAPVEQEPISLRRPNTEGADLPFSDFSKLRGILSISPKVLQNKLDSNKSWKVLQSSSRPSSEINYSRRNLIVSSAQSKTFKVSSSSIPSASKKGYVFNSKIPVKEKEQESMSMLLPAVAEDSSSTPSFLSPFYPQPEVKLLSRPCAATSPSKKVECFLPPIDHKDHVPSNVKLTRNLFTFFGSHTKCVRNKVIPTNPPISRPNTSISRKPSKYNGNLQNKQYTDELSSSYLKSTGTKRLSELSTEKPFTLFPIVTSLVPIRERNTSAIRRGHLNIGGGKKS